MPSKRFRLRPEQIRAIAPGRGSCFATDRIPVDGRRVGYMYREQPDPRATVAGDFAPEMRVGSTWNAPRISESTTSTQLRITIQISSPFSIRPSAAHLSGIRWGPLSKWNLSRTTSALEDGESTRPLSPPDGSVIHESLWTYHELGLFTDELRRHVRTKRAEVVRPQPLCNGSLATPLSAFPRIESD